MKPSAQKRTQRLAPIAAAFLVLSYAATAWLAFHHPKDYLALKPTQRTSDLIFGLSLTAFGLMGCIILRNRPDNRMGWVYLALGLYGTIVGLLSEWSIYGLFGPDPIPGGDVAAWLTSWLWSPMVSGIVIALLLFPNGRLPSNRWRFVPMLLGASILSTFIVGIFSWPLRGKQMLLTDASAVEGVPPFAVTLSLLAFPIFLIAFGSTAVSQVIRFRRSRGRERQQLKWLVVSVVFTAAVIFLEGIASEVLDVQGSVFDILAPAGLLLVPIFTGVAIMRYRLYEIDQVINRAVVYLVMSVVLIASYLMLVVALQRVLDPVRGDSDIAVVISTLGVAALFNPVRRRLQAFVDRRFYRRRYDSQQTLQGFSVRLRNQVNLTELQDDLHEVIEQTMQPAHASLWIPAPVTIPERSTDR